MKPLKSDLKPNTQAIVDILYKFLPKPFTGDYSGLVNTLVKLVEKAEQEARVEELVAIPPDSATLSQYLRDRLSELREKL